MIAARETRYLEGLVTRASAALGEVAGLYLFGSAAYGGYRPGFSDLDVQIVVPASPPQESLDALVHAVCHRRFPCPARRLELVVYPRAAVAAPTRPLSFALNLNTGRDVELHVATDPASEPAHWFLLDVAIGRELGAALLGPPPGEVFAPIPVRWQLEAILDSMSWHRRHQPGHASEVQNACRAWRYAVTGAWGSKLAGKAWVQARDPERRWDAAGFPALLADARAAVLARLEQEIAR